MAKVKTKIIPKNKFVVLSLNLNLCSFTNINIFTILPKAYNKAKNKAPTSIQQIYNYLSIPIGLYRAVCSLKTQMEVIQ